jgi:hypothetical protein
MAYSRGAAQYRGCACQFIAQTRWPLKIQPLPRVGQLRPGVCWFGAMKYARIVSLLSQVFVLSTITTGVMVATAPLGAAQTAEPGLDHYLKVIDTELPEWNKEFTSIDPGRDPSMSSGGMRQIQEAEIQNAEQG